MSTDATVFDYKKLFAELPEQYVVLDATKPGYCVIDASAAYLKVTGSTRKKLIGKKIFTVFPDTSDKAKKYGKGELEELFDRVIKTKKPESTGVIRYDMPNQAGGEDTRYWEATHYPYIVDGICIAIFQTTADVTDLVKSNENLKLANIRLEDALSAGMIGSWSWDIKKNIVTADKGLANIFGISPNEALQGLALSKFIDSIHSDDRDRVESEIRAAIAESRAFESEYRTIGKDGMTHWVIARGIIELDEKGRPTHFPGVMIDISSRKETEQQLKDSEERLRFMADTMPQLVWITRPDGYHEYYNRHWYEYTGTKDGSTDGEGWNKLFFEADRARAKKVWQHSLDTGEPYEIRYRLYNAQTEAYRWVIGRALPYRNDAGEIVKWYGTCTDINDSIEELEARKQLESELKEEKERLKSRVAERTSQLKLTNEGLREEIKKRHTIEKTLREYSAELKRSNKELEEFAYVSSHDLQEPLRKIQAFSDLLVDEYGEQVGEGRDYLDRIQASAQRMSNLIQDLLTFSRVTTKPAVKTPVDLNIVFQDAIADLSDRIETEKGSVEKLSDLPTVLADDTHMRQLLQNIISNGLKFHALDVPPKVEVSAVTGEDETVIIIKDYGIGIEPQYRQKIFAVFQRLNSKHTYDGTGIGLAVCKKIIDRYGGTIRVESQPGKGTSFIISLPVEFEE